MGGIHAIDPVTPYFPPQWNLADRIMYPFPLDEPVQMKNIQIEMIFGHDGLDLGKIPHFRCYLQFNGEEDLYQMNSLSTSPHGQQIKLKEAILVNHIDFSCYDAEFLRPSEHSATSSVIQISMILKDDDQGVIATVELDHTIQDQPLFLDNYSWTRNSPNIITVDITFYIPYTLRDVIEYDIYHPLLDLDTITAMHARGEDGGAQDDMELPYHLLVGFDDSFYPQVSCGDFTRGITYTNVDGKLIARLKTEKSIFPTNEGNICVISIEYPPETLDAIFKRAEATPFTATITSTHDQQLLTSTPVVKPSIVYRNKETADMMLNMLTAWTSDYHYRDGFTEFEIGIATTHLAKSTMYVELIHPPAALTFSVKVLGLPESQHVHDIMEWEPVIACRQHHEREYPADAPVVDGLIELASRRFHGFGLTCRIRLTKIPSSLPTLAPLSITFIPSDPSLDNPTPLGIALQTGMAKSVKAPAYILHDVTPELDLPSIVPLQFNLVKDGHRDYAATTFNVQYLPSRPSSSIHLTGATPSLERPMALNLFFTDLQTVAEFESRFLDNFKITARIPRRDSVVRNNPSMYSERVTIYGTNFANVVDLELDSVASILRTGLPVRCPTAIFPVNAVLDAARPLEFSIQFELARDNEGELPTAVYAALLPEMISQSHSYSPHYGYISPALDEPLKDYSYRCVTWDKLAAPYLYGASSPLPLTDDNSFPCPSHISPTTGLVDVSDDTIWRRVEHTWTPTGDGSTGPACFYELSAVCVTPSATVPGAYDTHLVADCPSFLDEVHSVPCSMLMDPPAWEYSLSSLEIVLGTFATVSDNFSLSWVYLGDSRLTLTVQIAASDSDQVPSSDDPSWIVLDHAAPAFISPVPLSKTTQGVQPVFSRVLPRFDRNQSHIHVKLTLNEQPDIEIAATTAYTPVDTFAEGCDTADHKEFDPRTNLCGCASGYRPSVLVGVDNPSVDPTGFTCILRCNGDAGETWNPTTSQCESTDGDKGCESYGVFNDISDHCVCFDGFTGDSCHYLDGIEARCFHLNCVEAHTQLENDGNECIEVPSLDRFSTTTQCNCLESFMGDQCQHQAVCQDHVDSCVLGGLESANGLGTDCKCKCANDNITGDACDQCSLPCQHKGVANDQCTACTCPDGYSGEFCQTPGWFHTIVITQIPQDIGKLLQTMQPLGPDAAVEAWQVLAGYHNKWLEALVENYQSLLPDFEIRIDDGKTDTATVRVGVELIKSELIALDPANGASVQVHATLFLPFVNIDDVTLAKVLERGVVDPQWSDVTLHLESFKTSLEEGMTFKITAQDPACLTKTCRDNQEQEEEEEGSEQSSNAALGQHTGGLLPSLLLLATVVANFIAYVAIY